MVSDMGRRAWMVEPWQAYMYTVCFTSVTSTTTSRLSTCTGSSSNVYTVART